MGAFQFIYNIKNTLTLAHSKSGSIQSNLVQYLIMVIPEKSKGIKNP